MDSLIQLEREREPCSLCFGVEDGAHYPLTPSCSSATTRPLTELDALLFFFLQPGEPPIFPGRFPRRNSFFIYLFIYYHDSLCLSLFKETSRRLGFESAPSFLNSWKSLGVTDANMKANGLKKNILNGFDHRHMDKCTLWESCYVFSIEDEAESKVK